MRLAITGDGFFLDRHSGLIDGLMSHVSGVDVVRSGNLNELWRYRILHRLTRGTPFSAVLRNHLTSLDRRILGYDLRTKQTATKLQRLKHVPDAVLHVFGSFAPGTATTWRIALYLDYTMALAIREWPPWAAFRNTAEGEAWLARERESYSRAMTICTMGERTAQSLVDDYGIPREKVQVVGSGGNCGSLYIGDKTFGSRQILFYGSEFERKGGDIVLTAFRRIREKVAGARLVIIGTTPDINEEGVESLGYISDRSTIERYFLSSDLVLAPSRCDPFPGFVIEAMNYGVPCVVSCASGISGALTHKSNAVLVDHRQPDEIADSIIQLLLDPAALSQISAGARLVVRDELNWRTVADRIASRLATSLLEAN